MLFTVLRFEVAFGAFIHNVIAGGFIISVFVSYQTKLCALLLVLWLTVINFRANA